VGANRHWDFPLAVGPYAEAEPEIDAFLTEQGVDGRPAFVSRMVIEEIVRNLIEHTPPYAVDERIAVDLAVSGDAVTVTITDTRPSFDPAWAPELDVTAPLEERRPGGMGVHLVRSLTDELRYERIGERNRLTAVVARR
jgi:serine/threonine-protein kinase RsbW